MTTLIRSALDASMRITADAIETIHNARATIPGARGEDEDYSRYQSSIARGIEALRANIVSRESHSHADIQTLDAVLDAVWHPDALNDRKLLLEKVLYLMSHLPDNRASKWLQSQVVSLLYNDLPHPPGTYIGAEYDFRQADGSMNNVNNPDLGRAGHNYARNVQGVTAMPRAELPDPELIWETLLKRENFVAHPAGNSSLMFGFATLVIHTCFRTNHRDWTKNDTSSYVDLSPLYGNDQEKQDKIRNKTGRGMLHNDVFAEDRLLFLPPIACVLLVLYSRNHNYIAEKLLQINERGTWLNPTSKEWMKLDDKEKMKQDDEIFGTARLINCGHFASAVFGDYVSAILGLVSDCNSWTLNPFDEIRKRDHTTLERGAGNANSVEFNLLYRWHATVSQPEERWVERMFGALFPTSPETMTVEQFQAVTKELKKKANDDVTSWTFDNLERDPDGRFHDSDLARILHDATTNPAGAFKARGTPAAMRIVEIMTINMARTWGVCTLNEFRISLGLRPYTSFQEWNPRKEIWQAAQKLYESIDRLELYPGLQAEETKEPGPGAGLCPGYTVSRAILADAIALTRGDRFFAQNMTPANYTAWGYTDCQRDPTNPGFGSSIGPLFLRTLPNHFDEDSTFTWFPMITPERIKKILHTSGLAHRYTFDRPDPNRDPVAIESLVAVGDLIGRSSQSVKTCYSKKAKDIVPGGGYLANLDDPTNQRNARLLSRALFHNGDTESACRVIEDKIRYLINIKSFDLVGKKTQNLDIVKDVMNLAPIHWIGQELGLPLKTSQRPYGVIFEQQADEAFKSIFQYIFMENDAATVNVLEDNAKRHAHTLSYHLHRNVDSLNSGFIGASFGWVKDTLWSWATGAPAQERHQHVYKVLGATGLPKQEIVNDILALAVLSTVELSQIFVHVINFYLEERNEKHKQKIVAAALGHSQNAMETLELYAREAIRLDPVSVGVQREITSNTLIIPNPGNPLDFAAGDRVFLSLKEANVDGGKGMPKRLEVDINNTTTVFYGDAAGPLLGEVFILRATAYALKTIFSLKNIRRAPGPSGRLRRYCQDLHGTEQWFYIDQKQRAALWPTSMLVQYDRT